MKNKIVILSEVPSIHYEIKQDGRRRYFFHHSEILSYIRNNRISFQKFCQNNKFDRSSYDNIRRSLQRVGGIRGESVLSSEKLQLNLTFGGNDREIYNDFLELCKKNKIKPQHFLKNYIRKYVAAQNNKN